MDLLLIVIMVSRTGRGMIQAIIHSTIIKKILIKETRPPRPPLSPNTK